MHMILHIDMDAFYASVEQRDRPELRGKPVIVGGPAEGRGVVSAASYEARDYGVHSAMPTARASRLCPHAVFLSAQMGHYAEVSSSIREVFHRYTPLVEPLSLDEAFLDVTSSQRLFGDAITIGRRIKDEIQDEIGLVASVGVAPNKFLAKLASDLEKPNGFTIVPPDHVQEFLDPLPISRIWGVGKATSSVFDRLGVRTIAQLRQQSRQLLDQKFGQQGEHLWKLARGIDDRIVVPDRQAKSISHEHTFEVDLHEDAVLRAWILELSDQVGIRLRRCGLYGKTVQLKIRFRDFTTVTRSHTLTNPTNLTQEIFAAGMRMFVERLPDDRPPIRLIGVGMSGLQTDALRQKMLFEETDHSQQKSIDAMTDEIRERFGQDAVARGSRLLHDTRHRPLPRPADHETKQDTPQS